MKILKNVLLGSAAGLCAITAGQAADLPVKAKPVEYVKICSLYGAGYYYMPGTDMCIKIGGYMRVEAAFGANGNFAWGPYNGNENNRTTNNFLTRARAYITADAREQTAYGTARAYIVAGVSDNNIGVDGSSNTFSSNRAFLQWAGFTAGLTRSFYDFYSAAAPLYRGGYIPASDTGDPGWWLWAYTAQLGSGLTATLSAEIRRDVQIVSQSSAGALQNGVLGSGVSGGPGYGGWQTPDIVANLRVDQTWGSAQIMGALHEVNPLYYGTTAATGHPDDQFGWALGGGVLLNFPQVAPGDYFQSQVDYTRGASRYINFSNTTNFDFLNGADQSFGINADCVFGGGIGANPTGCQLTTIWNVNVSYEHYWAPQWHQSLAAGYMGVSYNSQSNAILCALEGGGNGAGIGSAAVATAGCNNNWQYWGLGSRLQWDVTKTLYMGLELDYMDQESAKTFNGLLPAALALAAPGAPIHVANESAWAISTRVHKDFLP